MLKRLSLSVDCSNEQSYQGVTPTNESACRDGIVLACEILDCCPWFEFADLETYVSDDEGCASTDADSSLAFDDSFLDDSSRCLTVHGSLSTIT
jgi:hypothetical protein